MKLSAQPPPGYKHGQTRAPLIWEIAVPLNVVAIIMVCLRFYVRARLVKVVGKDDWLLLTAVLFLCGYVGSTLWGVTRGLGRHQYEVFQDFDPRKLLPVCYSFFDARAPCLPLFHASCCLMNWY